MSEPQTFGVRTARPSDAAALGRLGAQLVEVHHGFNADRFIAPEPRTAEGYGRFLVSELKKPSAILLVADPGDGVHGYVYAGVEGQDWMSLRGPAGVIYDLVVAPERRGTGIGGILLKSALEALFQRGAPRVLLSTAVQNEAAQRLFARVGFRPTMVEMTREWGLQP